MNIGNGVHGDGDDYDYNGDFCIGDNGDNVLNYGDYDDCNDIFKSFAPFKPHQSRTICIHHMLKANIS